MRMAKLNLNKYSGERLHLIDVSAIARTKWWYFKDLSWEIDGKEEGTGVMFAVLGLLKDIPLDDKIVFCFDFGGSTRKQEYHGYKADRQKASDDFYIQMNKLRETLLSCGYEVMGQEGYEADDFIVGATLEFKDKFDFIFVYTNDLDLTQLIDENVIFRSVRSKQVDITIKNYEKQLKIPYNTMVLYKATVGDPSDNIKGIYRFGPKKFEKFIAEIGKTYDYTLIRKNNLEREIIEKYSGFSDTEKEQALNSLNVVVHRLPNKYHFEDMFENTVDKNLLFWHLKRYGMKSILDALEKNNVSMESPYF